jgi:hypothetical protein
MIHDKNITQLTREGPRLLLKAMQFSYFLCLMRYSESQPVYSFDQSEEKNDQDFFIPISTTLLDSTMVR